MGKTPVAKSPVRNGLFPTERETTVNEEGAARELKQHTVESLERALERKMQKAGATQAMEETCMSFEDVPSEVIDEFCDGQTNARLKQFDRTKSTISIKMPTSIDESASDMGAAMVRRALKRAGMSRAMSFWGSTTGPDVPWRTRGGKSADASFQLRPRFRMGHEDIELWPQIVVETGIGMSEYKPELLADVAYWFKIAGGFLRVVVTISVKRRYVTIAVWRLGNRRGTFKHLGEMVAQRVDARLKLTATFAPIVVPFSVVFMREPHEWEGDLVFSAQDFMELKGDLEQHLNEREDRAKKQKPQLKGAKTPPFVSEGKDEEGIIDCDDIPQPKRRRRDGGGA